VKNLAGKLGPVISLMREKELLWVKIVKMPMQIGMSPSPLMKLTASLMAHIP